MKKLLFLLVITLVLVGWTVAQTSSSSSSAGQTGTSAQSGSAAGQTGAAAGTDQTGAASGQTGAAGTSDQNAASDQTAATKKGRSKRLPQTASPLPFLGLLGAGSLTAGLIARKRKA